ncbi:MAG: Vms1/Ankzf1 family peptidyl-tRNA hydrolase [Chloroflexota bacterium]|nr:Vms1/Ankzf1 family peptidyl-tRNA hydrolase [Chloroflexota bacterium]
MIDQAALQELVGFQAKRREAPVVSLYLDVDPRTRTTDEYRLALRHLLNSVNGQATREDVNRLEQFVEQEYDRQSRGLACFSCVSEELWQAYPLMVPVQDTAFAGYRPYLKPLSDALDTFARYGVLLVEQEGAHMFLFFMGELEGVSGITGEDIKRHKQGGWAAARYQRHEDAAAYRNWKEAAEMTAGFVRNGQVKRLVLAGTESNVAQFAALLPKAVQQVVVGTISADMTENAAEIGEKSMGLIREVAEARKDELVDELITTAAKGGPAALGLTNTLLAVYAGRAHHLLLDDEFTAPAYRCDNCGYVGAEDMPSCPLCGKDLRVLPDAADSLVRWAIAQGIDLTVINDNERLKEIGSVGALLRY